MKITHWWPLAFVLLVPIIIIMYMLKQKAKDQKVASLFLWKEMVKNDRANTPWEKLKKNWLLLLQILTLLVLIIALMSPYFMSSLVSSGKACVVIDTSASMGFMYDDNQTRFDKAKEEAISYVRKLKTGTEISLITSDRSAVLLASKVQNKSEVVEMIKNLEVSNYAGDTTEGAKMAKALATDSKGLQVLILTDSNVEWDTDDAIIVDVYSDLPNVGIEYVSHGYQGNQLTVLVKVTNYGNEPVKRDVSLYQRETLIANKEVEIDANSHVNLIFDNVNLNGDVYFAQVSGKDACDADNISFDVLTDSKICKVLLMTEANQYLEKALSLIPQIDVTKSNDISSFADFSSQQYDLYIFDGMRPDTLPSQGNIIMFNCVCDEIAPLDDIYDKGYLVEGVECSTTKYLDGMSFGVSNTYGYKVPEFAHTFLTAYGDEGDGKTKEINVGIIGEKQGRTYAMIGFDLHQSDFPLYMEFPILMYNLVNECIQSGIVGECVYESGDGVAISADVNGELPKIVKPTGETIELTDFRYNYTDTDQLGVYSISQTKGEVMTESSFVVNFPFSECVIDTHPSLIVSGDNKVVTEVKGVFNLRNFIIILALLMLSFEWIVSLRK